MASNKIQWTVLTVGTILIVALGFAIFLRDVGGSPAASTGYTPQTERQMYSMPPNMVVIGDSYTGGSDMGGRDQRNWVPILAKRLGYLHCSYAVGGSGWTQGRAGVTFGARVEWALRRDPDFVVFFNGVNDLKADIGDVGVAADAALANLRAQNPTIPVVVIGPVLVQDSSAPKTRAMADLIETAANRHSAVFVDPMKEGWFGGADRQLIGSDRFHPTDEGMTYLAEKVEQSLQSAGLADLPDRTRDDRVCSVPPPPAIPSSTAGN